MGFVIHWNESAMDLHVFPIPIPPPASLSIPSLWVFPVHQAWALVSCIQPGLVICFTLDNIHVSMLFSWNIPPSPSPTESKSLFYTSVSLFLFSMQIKTPMRYHYTPVRMAAIQKSAFGRSQDGGGIGRGDHFLFYKFIERTTERWRKFTKQLLIASRGH